MAAKGSLDRFGWERAIIGAGGPRSSTTRLVLLALATHIPRARTHAWPGIRRLEAETALSNRAVIDHLEIAVNEGWLRREITKLPEMRYRASVYWIQLPACAEPPSPHAGERPSSLGGGAGGEPPSPHSAPYPQNGSGGEDGAPSGERHAGQVVNVVPPTTMNIEVEHQRRTGTAVKLPRTTAKPNGKSGSQIAEDHGIVQRPGEGHIEFQIRAATEIREKRSAAERATEPASET